MLQAVVTGERKHAWDFSNGPIQVRLAVKVHNRRDTAASLCCETGTTLDLSTDAEKGATELCTSESKQPVLESSPYFKGAIVMTWPRETDCGCHS